MQLTQEIVLTFFRMGLATGLVERHAVIAWADRQIMEVAAPTSQVMELSLAANQSYSQMIGLLNQLLRGYVDYEMPLKLLFAHAGRLLENKPGQAIEIAQGLVLLLAEEFLPRDLQSELFLIEGDLELYQLFMLSYQSLKNRLVGFLNAYKSYESLVTDLIL